MYGLRLEVTKESRASLAEFAASFPQRIQDRVFRHAGRKASAALVAAIKPHVPFNRKPRYSRPHARDVVTFKQKVYKQSGTTLFVVGYESKRNNFQTLMERGNFLTRPRLTLHESNSGRVTVAAGTRRKRTLVTTASGKVRTVYEVVKKSNRRSTGSRRNDVAGIPRIRGNFPRSGKPYAPLTKAYADMRGIIPRIIEDDVRAGLHRALKP